MKELLVKCKVCGAYFEPSAARRTICSDECRKKSRQATAARSYQKDKEERKSYAREWRKNNPEKQRAMGRDWDRKNKEKRRELNREWKKNNPELYKASQKKAMKKLNVANREITSYSLNAWAEQVKDGKGCEVCGSTERVEAHHIFPKSIFPEKALQVDNGVALCYYHHKEHHKNNPMRLWRKRDE